MCRRKTIRLGRFPDRIDGEIDLNRFNTTPELLEGVDVMKPGKSLEKTI